MMGTSDVIEVELKKFTIPILYDQNVGKICWKAQNCKQSCRI